MNYDEQIRLHSPWLDNEHWEEKDRHLSRAAGSGLSFRHFKKELVFTPGSINMLRGPRQIGKSTECKFIARALLGQGLKPWQCLYFPCDNILNRKELSELMHLMLGFGGESGAARTIILDEITSVKEWHRTVKWMKDSGLLEKTALLLTGSSAYEMRRGYERMPGRREGGEDLVVLPMDFPEFVRLTTGREFSSVNLTESLASGKSQEDLQALFMPHQSLLEQALSSYLSTGGIPLSVASMMRARTISSEILEIYLSVIASEFEKQRRSTAILKALLRGLHVSQGSTTSFTRLASAQNIPSVVTVRDYLDLLHASFIGFPVYPLDLPKKAAFARKDRKYYFVDPGYAAAAGLAGGFAETPIPMRAESAVAVKLLRKFAQDWGRWGGVDKLFYWKANSGREIDFVTFPDNKAFGVEVKYQTQVSGWDTLSIEKGLGRGVVVSKNTFQQGKIPCIPLWAFLMCDV